MKDKKAIAATARLENHPAGFIILSFLEGPEDGGDFNLHPKVDNNSLYLADDTYPKYALQIRAESPAVLKRVANGLLALARSQEAGAADDDTPPEG